MVEHCVRVCINHFEIKSAQKWGFKMNKLFETFLNKSGKEKITIVILIGILLLVIALPSDKKSTKNENESVKLTESEDNTDDTSEYEAYIESRLENVLSMVDGVGDVKALVVLKNSKEKIIAADESSKTEITADADGSSKNTQSKDITNIYYDTNSNSQPYVRLENMPEVEGVVIVAKGGGDGVVAAEITSAIEALLGIPAHKIKVLKMS